MTPEEEARVLGLEKQLTEVTVEALVRGARVDKLKKGIAKVALRVAEENTYRAQALERVKDLEGTQAELYARIKQLEDENVCLRDKSRAWDELYGTST